MSNTLIWLGGLIAVGGVSWYLWQKGYFDNLLPDLKEEEKPDIEEEEEEEEEKPKCKKGEKYDEKKKKCVKTSKLAIAYVGQTGPYKAYKTYRIS